MTNIFEYIGHKYLFGHSFVSNLYTNIFRYSFVQICYTNIFWYSFVSKKKTLRIGHRTNLKICWCTHLCFCWKIGKSQSEGCQQSQRQLFHTVRSSESTFKISTKGFQNINQRLSKYQPKLFNIRFLAVLASPLVPHFHFQKR